MASFTFDGSTTYTGTPSADQFYMQDETVGVTIWGLDGADYVRGGGRDDLINGDGGTDYLYAGGGRDSVHGGDGDDVLYGGSDDGRGHLLDDGVPDVLYGDAGNDTLFLDFQDTAYGGSGDDGYHFNTFLSTMGYFAYFEQYHTTPTLPVVVEAPDEGIDTVFSIGGYDLPDNVENLVLTGAGNTGSVRGTGNSLDNVITLAGGQAFFYGKEGNDVLNGGPRSDLLDGGPGNDTLLGGAGPDTMVGGPGDDLYSVDDPGDGVNENPGEGYDEVYASVNFKLPDNAETLFLTGTAQYGTGNSGNNSIIGNSADNILDAGDGTFEFINGAQGNDLLIGGAGHDEIMGGPGQDLFRFASPSDGPDFFSDFTPGEDHIQLNAAAFGIGTAENPFQAGINFIDGPDVTSPVPTILYNHDNGWLSYDPDGTGATAPVLLAVLNGTPGIPILHASDFSFY